jgi:hypothetical protein
VEIFNENETKSLNRRRKMTKNEAIEKARENYMNCYWDQETKLSNLYDECDELEEGDLEEFRID